MYLPILSISIAACQLLPTFVDINLPGVNKESDSNRFIQYDKIDWFEKGLKAFHNFGSGPIISKPLGIGPCH